MDILTLLVFLATATATLAIAGLFGRRTAVRRRLARLYDGGVAPVPDSSSALDNGPSSAVQRWLQPIAERFSQLGGGAFGPVRERLITAGYRRESALSTYVGARVVLTIGLPLGFLLIAPALHLDQIQLLGSTLAVAAIGLVLPSQLLDREIRKRQRSIVNGLPDALDLMVVCVEAGLGVNACLARVSREFAAANPPLSSEFQLVTLEIRHGKSNTDALRGLAIRSGVSQISSLVAMLVQTERFGTSLADTLRVHADEMRVQRLLRAEEAAAKLPIKMLFPTVLIFIASLIVTIGPGVMQMLEFFTK